MRYNQILILLSFFLFSCTKENIHPEYPKVNVTYYGQTSYSNDSTLILMDSCLVRNDNQNVLWCYNYALNICIRMDGDKLSDSLNITYNHPQFQKVTIKHIRR